MTIVKLGIAALAATVALAGAARALDLKIAPPGPGKLVPTSVQLGIISPPKAFEIAWVKPWAGAFCPSHRQRTSRP